MPGMTNPGDSDARIRRGLNLLAHQEPRLAADSVERVLLQEYRRRHRRKTVALVSRLALAACALLALATSLLLFPSRSNQPTAPSVPSVTASVEPGADFVALPNYDEQFPPQQTVVVRVQMSSAELEALGLMLPQTSSTPVTADLAIGDDGLPYAVRLVGE